jgi:hypothetical protein
MPVAGHKIHSAPFLSKKDREKMMNMGSGPYPSAVATHPGGYKSWHPANIEGLPRPPLLSLTYLDLALANMAGTCRIARSFATLPLLHVPLRHVHDRVERQIEVVLGPGAWQMISKEGDVNKNSDLLAPNPHLPRLHTKDSKHDICKFARLGDQDAAGEAPGRRQYCPPPRR